MSNAPPTARWNVLFFGMPCAFSTPIMASLERPNVNLSGVVSPMRGAGGEPFRVTQGLRSLTSLSLGARGGSFHAPRWLVRDINEPRLADSLSALDPDLIVVACYPRLIPAAITSLARVAAINVHPSLLPRHRGPDPLFWTFQSGDTTAGVTIHILGEAFDAGDILAQVTIPIQPEESLPALEQRLAAAGANQISALMAALPALPERLVQDPSRATSESWPRDPDFVIDPSWPVTRARNFVAGVAQSHGPLSYSIPGGITLRVTGLAPPGQGCEIACANGSLRVLAEPV